MSATNNRSGIVLLFVAVLGIGLAAAPAQEPKNDKKPETVEPIDPKFERNPFETDAGIGVLATLGCVGRGDALGFLGARMLASRSNHLTAWHFEFDKVIPLNPRNLGVIEDNRVPPDLRRKEIKELKLADQGWYFAYSEAIWRSQLASMEMFDKSARDHPDVVYSHLVMDPGRYRGKVITVNGQLTRLEVWDAPRLVLDDGIEKVFVGEIHVANPRVPAYVVVFTDMPDGLKPAPKVDRAVTFQGYFLGNISPKKGVAHPYLVGKTLIVHDKKDRPPEVVESYSYTLIISTLGGIVGVVFIGAALSLWFRRSDQKIRSQLANVRDKHVPFSLEPDTPAADGPVDPPKDSAPPPT